MRDDAAATARLRQTLREAAELARATEDALTRAEAALEEGLQDPPEAPLERGAAPCEHRRQHRPGKPAKLDTDAELRAFILARIDALTFPQLEAEVAKAFPPARRIGKSAINDWWLKHRKALTGQSQPE